jgi:hypothetical protein
VSHSAIGLGGERKARMPDNPAPPGSPDSGTQEAGQTGQAKDPAMAAGPHRARKSKRLLRAKFLVPVVVCLAFGAGSWWLYEASSPGELPSPSYATLVLNSASLPVDLIGYKVDQYSDTAKIQVWVVVSSFDRTPGATLEVIPPNTTGFLECPGGDCGIAAASAFNRPQPLTFTPDKSEPSQETAYASFIAEKNKEFGDVANGVNASAAIPLVTCTCSTAQAPLLQAQYNLPAAISYDWSSFPAQMESPTGVTWQEPLAEDGETPGRVATGVDTSTQHTDGILTFIAGAFVGIAGGALLAAVTVALDPKD